MTAAAHPWRLVAPWYRWDRFPDSHPRDTAPVLQKYETAQLVELFLANPQHSLQFTAEDHVFETHRPLPPPGRSKTLGTTKLVMSEPPRRKLFLDSHKRFYLVVCELHCDVAGFPNAAHAEACQVGMVVRRRRIVLPDAAVGEAARRARRIGKRTAQVAALERRAIAPVHAVQRAGSHPEAVRLAYGRTLHQRRVRAAALLVDEQRELAEFAAGAGARVALEGWVPSELEGVGEWAELDDERPQALDEAVLPLYPLIPDPAAQRHAAGGRAIWFGLLPTGGSDVDERGAARFDDAMRYEVSCFVRRHDPHCPRTAASRRQADCRGELVWSRPTEPFQLASHFDLVGTSNRPVTIQMPDVVALAAQAATVPFGEGAPLRVSSPDGSSMQFSVADGKPTGASLGSFQICSFSIPLITIVAFFVFRLFLPIVMLLFGLFVLLRLRFCIPPSIEVSAKVEAALTAQAGGIDIDAGASFDVAGLRSNLKAGFDASVAGAFAGKASAGDQMTAKFENSALARLQHEMASPLPPRPAPPANAIPSPNGLATLLWETEVPVP